MLQVCMKQSNIRIGTCGFSYKDWLGNFYPQFCPVADFLRFYSSVFNTVEIDATFYRVPGKEMVKRWASQVREGFLFAAKFPRTVTHEGALDKRIRTIELFTEVMRHLDDHLGPLLLQFPYSFKPSEFDLLCRLIEVLPGDIRVAMEVRNKSWLQHDELFDLLRSRNVAFTLIDHPWMPRKAIITADFHYIRFLGDRRQISEDFTYVRDNREEDLQWWGEVIRNLTSDKQSLFAFFNNHYSGHSPSTARRLIELLMPGLN